jgi:hypothetical protein
VLENSFLFCFFFQTPLFNVFQKLHFFVVLKASLFLFFVLLFHANVSFFVLLEILLLLPFVLLFLLQDSFVLGDVSFIVLPFVLP